jgi:hypothetical protein
VLGGDDAGAGAVWAASSECRCCSFLFLPAVAKARQQDPPSATRRLPESPWQDKSQEREYQRSISGSSELNLLIRVESSCSTRLTEPPRNIASLKRRR